MSYLLKFEHGAPEVEELKKWLRGYITRIDYLTNPSPPLEHLRTALILACKEISQILDLQMESVIRTAKQPDSCIEIEDNDFWESRMIDFDGMLQNDGKDIRGMEKEDVIAFLEASKDEIEWLQHEMRRLDLHIDNARDAIREGRRRSFAYAPTPRKGGEGESVPSEIADAAAKQFEDASDAQKQRSVTPQREMGPADATSGNVEMRDGDDRMRRSTTPERRLGGSGVGVEEGEVKSEDERRDSGGGGGDAEE
ncbi:uncharacterized protein MYCFIDRAFT_82577 [Pseudocercospora fijiensis CIRAD86]|uniref:Uncharacterized protein n=1 Tax=Pseudocercospora fijiensis (strain CIRAD86) TaxID=383855 RepID=M3B8N0_PSEFD|nr:uncharacterized protein MYCFIDRAFT_82577 [Pseudocercospora fijiensis CIRAD86]EME85682.1 hypothetical protein MYCFIDRAFT_82577 [Pseudocercospora fijiensis CIRAD86]